MAEELSCLLTREGPPPQSSSLAKNPSCSLRERGQAWCAGRDSSPSAACMWKPVISHDSNLAETGIPLALLTQTLVGSSMAPGAVSEYPENLNFGGCYSARLTYLKVLVEDRLNMYINPHVCLIKLNVF